MRRLLEAVSARDVAKKISAARDTILHTKYAELARNEERRKTQRSDISVDTVAGLGNGNCSPAQVRAVVSANDLSALTGEGTPRVIWVNGSHDPVSQRVKAARTGDARRSNVIQEAVYENARIVQYNCSSIDVFVDGKLQSNAIKSLRSIAKPLDVSEYNSARGVRNTRSLGKAIIEAIRDRGRPS